MKKNKKLFAILTLVAFMITLMPVMAFAAFTDGATTEEVVANLEFELLSDGKVIVTVPTTVVGTSYMLVKENSGTVLTKVVGTTVQVAADVNGVAFEAVTVGTDQLAVIKKASSTTPDPTGASDTDTVGFATADTTATKVAGVAVSTLVYTADGNATVTTGGTPANNTIVELTGAKITSVIGKAPVSVTPVPGTVYAAVVNSDAKYLLNKTIKNATTQQTVPVKTDVDAAVELVRVSAANTDATAFVATPTQTLLTKAMASYNALNATSKTAYVATASGARVLAADKAVAAWNAYVADSGSNSKLIAFKSAYATATAADVAGVTGVNATILTAVSTSDLAVAQQILKDNNIIGGGTGGGGVIPTPTPTATPSPDASIIATQDASAAVEVCASAVQVAGNALNFTEADGTIKSVPDTKYADLDVVFRAANNASAKKHTIYVWAEETGKSKQGSDALVLSLGTPIDKATVPAIGTHKVYKIDSSLLTDGSSTLMAAFVRGGNYTLKASFDDPTPAAATENLKSVTLMKNETDKSAIKATALAQETRLFKLAVGTGTADTNIDALLADGEKTDTVVEVAADTVATTKVTLTVYNKLNALMSTYPIKLSTNSGNIELDKTSITTDYKGQASFNIAGLREGSYKVYVNIGDYEATINVQVGATSANGIDLIKFPSNPIATDTLVDDYADIFRIQLTDANGNIVSKKDPKGALYAAQAAPSSEKSMTDQAKYASVVKAPTANKVKDADLKLKYVAGKDYYTLDVENNKAFEAEGDYEVRVVLDNGKSVTINFTVKKFETATSLTVEYPTSAVELNSKTATPDIFFLDANKVMKKANNRVNVVAKGYAVASVVPNGKEAGQITVKNDEKYVGSTITVVATSDKENLISNTVTLTVADEARDVKLDTTRGQVNANNRVGFKVLDSKGNSVALGNEVGIDNIDVTAIVTNTGDKDAKVSYSISGTSKSDLLNKGVGVINLSSNKETTATVQVMVKVTKKATNANDNNTGLSTTYYTGNETFTFGAEAQKSVVMTIGSKEIVANNVPTTTDVAPFIKDSRTYVPFRALVEAFGAEVVYDETAQTVTAKLAGKTVVMTVGSNILTVNDKTVTMEGAAPYIVDNRVVVPVRFVGEAFGFTVTAIADDATGATASVVFYQK